MSQSVKLDPEALRYWIEVRGRSPRDIEEALGFGNGKLGKYLNGQTNSMSGACFFKLARLLAVPLEAVLAIVTESEDESRLWKTRMLIVPEHDSETMAEYAAICSHAKTHLTLHHSLNSYLIHPDHFLSQERIVAQSLQRSSEEAKNYIERAGEFKKLMASSQGTKQSEAVHWVVTQQAAFDKVVNPEWVEVTLDRVIELGFNRPGTQLVISMLPAPAFACLHRRVSMIVGSMNWVAINLVDQRYALVQKDEFHTMACYHPGTVSHLRDLIQKAVQDVDHNFPKSIEFPLEGKYLTRQTHDFLVNKARKLRNRSK